MKERITVTSKASERVVPKIWAKVKIIVPKAPTTHNAELIRKRLRSFSPEVVKNPSLLMRRKAIANNAPTVANPPNKFRNLKAVVNEFIG
jgi:hypothetical protein